MTKHCRWIAVLLLLLSLPLATARAAADAPANLQPTLNQGKKWRIGYLEGGPYANYPQVLKSVINGLAALGWLEPVAFPQDKDVNVPANLWKWIGANVKSDYLEFPADAFYTSRWDEASRAKTKEAALTRLATAKDIDLMIAMGTWAGQDLANDRNTVPTLVFSSTDPIAAGIVKSVGDSGRDNINARLDPTIHERQLRLFHDIIGFKKLGVAYEDSVAGKSYAALPAIEQVAAERGFTVVPCFTKASTPDTAEAEASVIQCARQLAPNIDAMYLTIQKGLTPRSLPQVMEALNGNNVPTFSQNGSDEVRQGALLSLALAGFKYVGRFHAETMAGVFHGAKPRQLPQLFEDPPKIAINLQEAQIIGYDPPVDIIAASDEIYQEIEPAPAKAP
ncbi:MAG: ABC transporter substrate-binding protein [Solidesulfovibrio sp. DCME]|uniref:ABC transporter substrate-binding protein n=1 Tax=Solidesulfovibrio sp. DCME TaxID=3447380 RepID=UPI003D141EA2